MSLYVPNVFSDYVLENTKTRLVMDRVSTDVTKLIKDLTIQGKTIDFPVIDRTVEAQEIAYQSGITLDMLSMSNSTAEIKHISAGFKIHNDDLRRSREIVLEQGIIQIADTLATKFDSLLMESLINESTLKQPTTDAVNLTEEDLIRGLGLFGDKRNISEMAGIIVHSNTLPSLFKMDGFTNKNLTFTTDVTGKIENQIVGQFQGINVMLSNNGTMINGETVTSIVKHGGLGYAYQQNIQYSESYDVETFTNKIVASMYLATKVLDTSKIVILKKTIAK